MTASSGLEATDAVFVLDTEVAVSNTSLEEVLAPDDLRLTSGLNSSLGSGHSAAGA